jgi:hypothetical protein
MRWAYAATLTLPNAIVSAHQDQPALVRIQGTLREGPIAFGVLRKDGQDWVTPPSTASVSGAFDTYVTVPRLGDASDLVVMNWNQDGVHHLNIDHVAIYVRDE